MKFLCECGFLISDSTDHLPYKAYSHPDESFDAVYDAIDRLMKFPPPDDQPERDQLTFAITEPIGGRTMYQCPECGRIFIWGDERRIYSFKPEDTDTPKNLFEGKPGPHRK
jgi:hypothetical protein